MKTKWIIIILVSIGVVSLAAILISLGYRMGAGAMLFPICGVFELYRERKKETTASEHRRNVIAFAVSILLFISILIFNITMAG